MEENKLAVIVQESGLIAHDTQEGRLYRISKAAPGHWFDGLTLSQRVRTIALHSCAHGLRQQLPTGETLKNKVLYKPALKRKESYYRLVTPQMELGLEGK